MHSFIDQIITFSLKNKFFIFFCTAIAIIIGCACFKETPISRRDQYEGHDYHAMARTQRRGGREIHYDPDRDRHELCPTEKRYPKHDLVRAFGRERDVRR